MRHSRCKAMICAPKGIKETLANLKNCIPKGIPIMVIHHKIPNRQDVTPNSQPNNNIQIMFSKKLPAPFEKITSLPKGQMIKEANLKHCIPTGIAIIVQQQSTLLTAHKKDRNSPPKTSHKIFPSILTVHHRFSL